MLRQRLGHFRIARPSPSAIKRGLEGLRDDDQIQDARTLKLFLKLSFSWSLGSVVFRRTKIKGDNLKSIVLHSFPRLLPHPYMGLSSGIYTLFSQLKSEG